MIWQRLTIPAPPAAVGPILIGERQEIPALGRAGVVDHNIDSSELSGREVRQLLRGLRITKIERDHDSGSDFSRYRVEGGPIAPGQDDPDAVPGEPPV